MQIGDILSKLQKVKSIGKGEYASLCPAHVDKNPSLHIRQEDDKILINCKAGCAAERIVESMGLTMSDLFVDSKVPSTKIIPKIICEYDYKDENGNFLFQTVRYVPKDFRQRHKNGNGEWVWNLEGVRRVLYHLDDLVKTNLETIYLVEGEKDADNLWNWGKIATTSPCGAGSWRDEYADMLIGKRVVIIPDKDTAGMSYARQVANSLTGKARELKVILLHGDKVKDITDWLDAGGDVETLNSLEQDIEVLTEDRIIYQDVEDSIIWNKKVDSQTIKFSAENISAEKTGTHARLSICFNGSLLAWSYFNIERDEDRTRLANAAHKQIAGDFAKAYEKDNLKSELDKFCQGLWNHKLSSFVPEEFTGDDTPMPLTFLLNPYLICKGGTILYAPPGRGKSYTALLWAVAIDAGVSIFWSVHQTKILFINLERSKETVRRRLAMVNRILGLPANRPLLMMNARGKTLAEVAPACRKAIKNCAVGMIVLDSISRAGLGDLNENLSGNKVVDMLSSMCPSWLALGHTPRQSENHIFGSVMQDAGADICVQLNSQTLDDYTLGVGWEITKQNDIGRKGQQIWALEFNDLGLTACRKAKPFEFPEIEGKGHQSMDEAIKDFILEQDSADSTATEIAKATKFNRVNVAHTLKNSGKYRVTRKGEKNAVYYGLAAKTGDENTLL